MATPVLTRFPLLLLPCIALVLMWCVGILGRGFWTPDEPREADIAWRMSWQADRSVPLLAGEAFCEKPPLTYWMSAASIAAFGESALSARVPNLLYAVITALAVGCLGRRSAGPLAGAVAAATVSTFLLSYQVAIWLATDAPLMAAVAVALLGLHAGFHAVRSRDRLIGYCVMHAALALGFLAKSAVAWMVPALALATLIAWEKRWRELWRWELYVGLVIQAMVILTWVAFVHAGPDGAAHLRVFFWNNLVGRFAKVDAPDEFQYATAHRNSPGKYLIEMPLYLWPWTLLAAVAVRRAWRERHAGGTDGPTLRFAVAAFVPTVAVLSLAATARNIYLAPALPGVALLLGWWARRACAAPEPWDVRALQATCVLLLLGVAVVGAATALVGWDAWSAFSRHGMYVGVSAAGLALSALLALGGARWATRRALLPAMYALLLSYCVLLTAPAGQIYQRVDAWQDLASVGRAMARDSADAPMVLFAADETTRAFIDQYARQSVTFIAGPIDAASTERLRQRLRVDPQSVIVAQVPGSNLSPALRSLALRLGLRRAAQQPAGDRLPLWIEAADLHVTHSYALPNGRRYVLLATRAP